MDYTNTPWYHQVSLISFLSEAHQTRIIKAHKEASRELATGISND